MRMAFNMEEFERNFLTASSEAKVAFGNGNVYIERLVQKPRHVEIQVMADQHGNVFHFGERDCSMQRRHQKVIEEAPSPALSPEIREKMGTAAVNAAKAVNYVGAGTVEFLLDESKEFFFMEMNTRIQVEHCVTEMITGFDLVKMQIQVAQGEKLNLVQSEIPIRGHAIEFRINAEDWKKDFLTIAKMRGMGWAMLVQDLKTGKLMNTWVNEHDAGMLSDVKIILNVDMFEHAFIKDFGTDRVPYLDSIFAHIDWSVVSERLN
jgi:acetyl/propionyl-CoA carboxylase alpha subunit